MANFSGMVLTTRGRNLLAKALTGTTLTFTKVKLGSGQYDNNTDITNLNDLLQPRLALPIQSIEVIGDGTAKIRFVLRNDSLQEGFFLSEIGVFANDPDLGEILYSVAYTSQPDFIPSSQTTRIEIVADVYVVVSNAQSVTATISDTLVLATREDIGRLENKLLNGEIIVKNANSLQNYIPSTSPSPNTIPVAGSTGTIDRGWLPITWLSLLEESSNLTFVPVPFSTNTIYRTNKTTLFLFSYQDIRVRIGPTSPPSLIQLTTEHNYSTADSDFGLFIVPENWYWLIAHAGNSTLSGATNGLWEVTVL